MKAIFPSGPRSKWKFDELHVYFEAIYESVSEAKQALRVSCLTCAIFAN